MAFPTGWGRKQEIIFDYTKVVGASDHSNIFVPIKKNYLDAEILNAGANSALSGGLDIRVTTDEDGLNEIPVHMLVCNPDATEGNRKFAAFVLLPNLSVSVNTSIWIWYRNALATLPAVGDTYGRNAVWAQMEAVILGNEASGTLYDATGNGYDATLTSGTQISTAANHPIDGLTWIDFNGSSWYTLASSAGMLDGSANMFLSAWQFSDNNFSFRGLIGNRNNSPSDTNWFHLFSRPYVQAKAGGGSDEIEGSPVYGSGELHFTSAQHDGSTLKIYADGVLVGTDDTIAVTSGIAGVADYRLGTYYNASNRYDGRAGLFMAGFGPYDADWLETIYNSVVDADFASAGTPEDVVANNPATGSVSITGTPTEGQTLTITNTIADADGLGTFIYTLYRDDVLIPGADASTYVPNSFDVNTFLKARIDFTDGGGAAEYKVSSNFGPIAPAPASTYSKCKFPITVNPAFLDNSISGDPFFSNFVLNVPWAKIPAAFKNGGSQSAENGGGNIQVFADEDLTSRLAADVTFDINAETGNIKALLPILMVSTGITVWIAKVAPDVVHPDPADPYGSDELAPYDPDLVPPADPSDLKTTYDNQTNEADFMTAGSMSCTTIGAPPVAQGILKPVLSDILRPVLSDVPE